MESCLITARVFCFCNSCQLCPRVHQRSEVCLFHVYSFNATRLELVVTVLYFDRYLLAVGLESGDISLYSCCLATKATADDSSHWSLLLCIPLSLSHTSTVKRLKWQPTVKTHLGSSPNQDSQNLGERTDTVGEHYLELILASCSTDHSVKLFQIHNIPK